MALFWRIWFAVTIANLIVLTIFVTLATLQFGNINSGLVGDRLVVLADSTAAPFRAAAKIGLPLSSVRNAEALLERARQSDDSIQAIHVFDADGRIIKSTAVPAPAAIPPEGLAARAAANGAPWHRETADGFLSSIDIRSTTGTTVGGILIVYPGGGNITQILAMAAELGLAALGVMIIAAGLSGILMRFGLRRQIALFDGIDRTFTGFERNAWRSAAGGVVEPVADDTNELLSLLDTAEARYRAVGQSLGDEKDGAP
ncbi:hypothetical protein [Microbaculum sp. FT89]|uniref:hypothetical protein n=1 Tax=Microbaculum sp. FT89 TaxID=3447298 RepID=UPI003F52AB53